MAIVNKKIVQLIFSNCFHGKRPLWEFKLVKTAKTSICIVNKRLKEANVKFLIEHDKKEFNHGKALLIEGTPDTDEHSDTSNELKQILVRNYFYVLGKAKTYINFTPI